MAFNVNKSCRYFGRVWTVYTYGNLVIK